MKLSIVSRESTVTQTYIDVNVANFQPQDGWLAELRIVWLRRTRTRGSFVKPMRAPAEPIYQRLPDDSVLAALGRLALRQGHIDNQLRMLVMDLTSVTKAEALYATRREGSAQLRGRVQKLAKQRLGDGNAFVRLQALLARAGDLTNKRNELVHTVWGTELEGEPAIRTDDHNFTPAPTVAELDEVHEQMAIVLDELIMARTGGFLSKVLAASTTRR